MPEPPDDRIVAPDRIRGLEPVDHQQDQRDQNPHAQQEDKPQRQKLNRACRKPHIATYSKNEMFPMHHPWIKGTVVLPPPNHKGPHVTI